MDNNMMALLNLYLSLGGNLTDTYDNIANGIPVSDYTVKPDIIDAIAERAKSAGIELPAVTSVDNGDVLTVIEGAWAKADPPTELPTVTDIDEGKFLRVNSSGQWVADTVPSAESEAY